MNRAIAYLMLMLLVAAEIFGLVRWLAPADKPADAAALSRPAIVRPV